MTGRALATRAIRAWYANIREPPNHERCAHDRCHGRVSAIVVWLSPDWQRISTTGICYVHAELVRTENLPAILLPRAAWTEAIRDRLLAQITAEVQRRRIRLQPMGFPGYATTTTGGSSTTFGGYINISFG